MKLFKRKFNAEKALANLVKDLNEHHNATGADYDELLDNVDSLSTDFYSLRDEIATNGVVRDLRKLQKDHAELERNYLRLVDFVNDRFNELDRNGMATAVNKLNKEVFAERKPEAVSDSWNARAILAGLTGIEYTPAEDVTLAGKVNAIIEHLGLDVSVKPKEVKVTEAKVVVSKLASSKASVKKAKKGKK